MTIINREYKSSIFADYFGNAQYKDNLLSLFNALNDTHYSDVNDLTITTIDNVIYMGIKNDVSCLIDSHMSLLEHQSTFNPNMPLRGLMYFGKLYGKYLSPNKEAIYRTTIFKVPTPQYFVLYNGSRQQPEVQELRLSDAFIHPDPAHRYEWTAIMLNINPGYNQKLVNSCKALKEYAIFVDKVKQHLNSGLSIEEAVVNSVDECIANNIMKDYLLKNKAGVITMCLTEYDAEKHMQDIANQVEEFKAIIEKQKDELSAKDVALQKQQKKIEELEAKLKEQDSLKNSV